jgi:hypothetical protein
MSHNSFSWLELADMERKRRREEPASGEIVTWVIYQSHAWKELVEIGWTTDKVVKLPDGEATLARMVWTGAGRPPRA